MTYLHCPECRCAYHLERDRTCPRCAAVNAKAPAGDPIVCAPKAIVRTEPPAIRTWAAAMASTVAQQIRLIRQVRPMVRAWLRAA